MDSVWSIAPSGGSFTLRFLAAPLAFVFVLALLAGWRGSRRLTVLAAFAGLALETVWAGLYGWRPRWLVLALDDPRGAPALGEIAWTERAPGLESAELAISLAGERVDTIALVRLDPARYALSVHWDGAAPKPIDAWQRRLGAAVVINGSYFERDRRPSTPLRIGGRALGPRDYVSSHGALVIGESADIVDLRGLDVGTALAPYDDAMVSYPLLVDPRGSSRAAGNDDWFANRVFIGVDTRERIVIGTTRTGFFSLRCSCAHPSSCGSHSTWTVARSRARSCEYPAGSASSSATPS